MEFKNGDILINECELKAIMFDEIKNMVINECSDEMISSTITSFLTILLEIEKYKVV